MAYIAKVKPGTTENLLFDVFVDDRLVAAPGGIITDKEAAEWRIELPMEPGRPRRVTVYLPYLAQITVREMEVAADAVWQPMEAAGPALLCLGDSITQGLNASRPSSTYAALLSRFLGMNLINQAVSGYVFDAETIDPDSAPSVRPTLITVAYGTNDWVRSDSLAQFTERADAYLTRLESSFPGVPIAVFTPIFRMDVSAPQRTGTLDDIRAALQSVCSGHPSVRCVDGLTLVPHLPDYFADGLHPNNEGALQLALNAAKRLREAGLA
jgi:lysophospholipase L1-like esterase